MERLHRCEFIDAFAGAPSGEAPGGVHIGPAGMVIVNLPCEKFQDALCGFWGGREEWRRLEIRRGRKHDFGDHAVDISHFFTCPLPGRQACDKGRYHTLKALYRDVLLDFYGVGPVSWRLISSKSARSQRSAILPSRNRPRAWTSKRIFRPVAGMPINSSPAWVALISRSASMMSSPSKRTAIIEICSSGIAALTCRRNILSPSGPRGYPIASSS
jgi:hypothetical protein